MIYEAISSFLRGEIQPTNCISEETFWSYGDFSSLVLHERIEDLDEEDEAGGEEEERGGKQYEP